MDLLYKSVNSFLASGIKWPNVTNEFGFGMGLRSLRAAREMTAELQ